MYNHIKYGLKRQLPLLCAGLVGIITVNLIFAYLYGVQGAVVFNVFSAWVLPFCYLGFTTATYNTDVNTKTRYMTFMMPISGYKIACSWLLQSLIFGFILVTLWGALFATSTAIMRTTESGDGFVQIIKDLWEVFGPLLERYGLVYLALQLLRAAIYLVAFTLTIFVTRTLSKSLLSNIKVANLFALALFSLILYGVIWSGYHINLQWTLGLAQLAFFNNASLDVQGMLLLAPSTILAVVYCVCATLFTGWLLENKINL